MRQRKAIRRYEALVAAVTAALNAADPISLLELGAPNDEYQPEVGTIVPRAVKAVDLAEVHQIIHDEFASWFGVDTAGSKDAYAAAAQAIWEAVLSFRQAA